jgi:hypothetical protein
VSYLQHLYRRVRYGEPVIVVSGLPRAGTSMAMKMLEAASLPLVTDDARSADEDNPRGYYEDERVKELARARDKSWLRACRGRVIKVISYLLEELPDDNNYQVIFMRRDLGEVLASQRKMLERRDEVDGTPDERMLEHYESHLWRVGYRLRRWPHFESLDVSHRAVLDDPPTEAQRIAAFLGRPLDVEKMAAVVDQRLYRNRKREAVGASS